MFVYLRNAASFSAEKQLWRPLLFPTLGSTFPKAMSTRTYCLTLDLILVQPIPKSLLGLQIYMREGQLCVGGLPPEEGYSLNSGVSRRSFRYTASKSFRIIALGKPGKYCPFLSCDGRSYSSDSSLSPRELKSS